MAKVFVPQSSCIFAVIIFLLLVLSVGLLVFVLKGQLHHENSLSSRDTGHVGDSSVAGVVTHTPSPQTASKTATNRSTESQLDVDHTTESVPEDHRPWEDFRLPKYIIPMHYDLLLYPNLETDIFTGTVNITVNVTRQTKHFVVHAYRLTVKDSKVYDKTGAQEYGVNKHFLYDLHEYLVVEMDNIILPATYKLSFNFNGSLLGSIVGFYKSRYTNSNNETRFLATSKFQPTYARRAFPCFDEPSFKATFSVSLVHSPNYIALSNMPVEVTESFPDNSQLLITKFQKSVPMVTYLACFIVCDFKYTGTKTSSGKEFRVYSAPDQVNKTAYALKFGSRVLEYFENYFGIAYPLPKQDMVAIPDFVSGAMEHWGVITFRETNLLYDKENSSPQNKQRVSTVISHEMAHMWFGNLVTMEWWDDLWLNEGFASYVEYKGVHEQHPEWDVLSQFVTEDVQPVMDLDSTMSSHPIVQPVTHPDEITEIFDDISYGKGASVLRMLEFFVGKDNFRRGISRFLKKYQFRNAQTADLWQELSNECGYQGNHTIASIMKTWTEQMGFPYIDIRRSAENSSVFVAKQKRFVKNEALYRQKMNSSKEYTWSIPLSYITENGQTDVVWIFDEKEAEFAVPMIHNEWVKFNVNQTGYYLVNYEENDWNRLTELLMSNHESLSPSDRSNLLFDTFLLAEAGHIQFDVFLSMTKYLKNETHLIPWETAYASFVYLCQLLEFTDVNFLLKSYVKDLTDALYKTLGWKTTENHLDNLLRTTIIGLACHSGNQNCLSDASQLFQNWTQGQEIPSNLRSLVYHYGMAEIGREEHWNYMWNKFLMEESPPERKTLLYGLAHVRVPYLIHRYLEYAMDDTKIRRQDFFAVLSYIAGNPVGRPFVWNFIKEKWPVLVEKFTLNDRYLGLAVKKVCSYFTSDLELQEMKAFFAKYPDAGAGKRKRQQALENVQNNIKWLKTYKQRVKKWLEVEGTAPWYYYRLPSHIKPEHYEILLYPMLEADTFNGTVTITVNAQKPTDCFLVHVVDLNVTRTEIRFALDDSLLMLEDVFPYEENSYLVLKVRDKVPPGRYKLFFQFEGPLTLSLKGLYKSSYVDPDSKERKYLAVTQFEAIEARRAFPCFDEPIFKSTFSVQVIHNASYFALSNTMAEEIVELDNGRLLTKFEKTVPMVTYLLAVVVCDFKFKETITENGVRLRIYTAPHHIEKTSYALEMGSKTLSYYEKYFDVAFPLKKLDMIAIPDYGGGAMENWGLITFSEPGLISENVSSIASRYQVSELIAHEIAHMWFGNLVTMKWWDDLWLNEGFATYISEKGLKNMDPKLDEFEHEATDTLCRAMLSDKTVNSHAIVQQVTFINSDIFDSIAYSKGSSILRMLENYMGEDFRQGVSNYLKKYAYGSAKTDDLWTELTAASKQGLNVSLVMDTWTKQMNYPYINVERNDDGGYVVQQHRYLEDPESKIFATKFSPYNYIWQIPLTYRTAESEDVSYILLNTSEKVNLSLPKSEWIKFNVNFTGYYLVNYDLKDWRKFIRILQEDYTAFSPSDRVNLLFEAFALASAGHLEYEIPLNLTFYLKKETYHGAWSIALEKLVHIKEHFRTDRETRDVIKEYIRSLSKDLLRKYTWNDTGNYSERKLRRVLIHAACGNGNYECLINAGKLFKQWMAGAELSPEIDVLVYTYGLQVLNDEDSWNYVWQKYLEESDPDEALNLQYALTTVRNATLLERLVELAKNESLVRKHHYFSLLRNVAGNPKGFALVTQLIYNNWTEIVKRHGIHEAEVFASAVFSRYETERDLGKVRQFYRKHKKTKDAEISRIHAIENILENIRWHKKHKDSIKAWMEKNTYMPWNRIRLPRHIIPNNYNLKLMPDIIHSTFRGEVEIEVNVTKETDYMLIHESSLKIQRTELRNLEFNESISIDEAYPFRRNHFWVIRFAEALPTGIYILKMIFSGKFVHDGNGMTRYHYIHRETKEKRYLIATQFEPTDARKVFPCFDEPDMKAKFKLTIVHDAKYISISNMPEEARSNLNDSLVETIFSESVPMSTYLVCCVVCDFEYLEAEYKGKKIRAYAPSDRIQEAEHGLNMTVKILEKYEEYFSVDYVLPKLDSVAIPNFTVPAMEHWGVITYNTRSFLVDETVSPFKRMADIDRVIAHELAHQWFGNLVTMKWWNDLWLNEGVSTLIMYIPLKEYYPAIGELDVRKVSKMMCSDSSLDSHPILHNVSNPGEISDLFDTISYEKGSAVLKMLQYTLKDDFRLGLSNYLKKYAYKNAETKDLWVELSNASRMDVNITEVMDTWTLQMGFPYVELERKGRTLTVTQHWFLRRMNDTTIDGLSRVSPMSPFHFIWKIPLVYKNLASGNEYTLWLNDKNATFLIQAEEDDVIKFNPGFVGFYIVKYDDSDWEKLNKRLQESHTDFSVTDRYNLLHDAFLLAETDRLIYDIPLELTKYLKKEKEVMPWNLFRDHFIHFLRRLDGQSETVQLLKKYAQALTADLYDEYVWTAKNNSIFKKWDITPGSCSYTFPDLDFVSTIVDVACESGNPKCLQTMNEELELWMLGKNISSDLHFVLKMAVPEFGNDTLWEYMYGEFIADDLTYKEKLLLAEGFVSFTGSLQIRKTIDLMMNDPAVDTDIARALFRGLGSNPVALPILWNYTKKNWDLILNRLDTKNSPTVGISVFCEAFRTQEYLSDFVKVLKHVPQINELVMEGCIQEIDVAVLWSEKYEDTLQSWLRWNVS